MNLTIIDNQQYHLLSDLKFNEGYASFKVDRMNDAIDAFSKSHNFALKSKYDYSNKSNGFLKFSYKL